MRFRFVEEHRDRWPIQVRCRVLGVATSGYDAWRSRGESDQAKRRRKMVKLIQVVPAEHQRRYDSPRIYRELLAKGYPCSKNFIAKLMQAAIIRAKTKRKFRQTTDSRHKLAVSPNLLNRDFTVKQPNQVGLSEITYIPTREGWLYLCTVEDLFSRKIVGWSFRHRINRRLVVDAMKMAISLRQPKPGMILPSDRGSQY